MKEWTIPINNILSSISLNIISWFFPSLPHILQIFMNKQIYANYMCIYKKSNFTFSTSFFLFSLFLDFMQRSWFKHIVLVVLLKAPYFQKCPGSSINQYSSYKTFIISKKCDLLTLMNAYYQKWSQLDFHMPFPTCRCSFFIWWCYTNCFCDSHSYLEIYCLFSVLWKEKKVK